MYEFNTSCIVCRERLLHIKNPKSFNRIAHEECAILMRELNKKANDKANLRVFGGLCVRYDIKNTDKLLYMELAIKNL